MVSGSIKKLFSLDYVNIYFAQSVVFVNIYLFLIFFFNKFYPVGKSGITPHCLHRARFINFKGTWTDIYKMVSRKVLLMWSSMPIFSFIGYSLTELFRKSDNWRQIYKQTSLIFYTLKTICREEKNISTS